ncbi:class II aldolase/adducin family protein [Methylomicrobium sp. Wu6]|uniref:class II aldolase/adducin family protein n=1 Tax=Methylomicrobium sp. Wu6 TaxID=3107928 RepID=UPI002DD68DC1|nr:class II aldolase/adducin family protein [Methylomicrobium sp. Wu6]MEC4749614.1 class II aldolase/adducin family protein [Methylomicrobium sp. Wu6]
MAEQEGVIKFRLDYQVAPARIEAGFAELNAWRSLLWRLGMIGQDGARYDGLGYGNLSLRLDAGSFLITGTQTGHIPQLTAAHYACVLQARPDQNYLSAEGPLPPSSEALTHAAVYSANPTVCCVAHGHSPGVWRNAVALKLPCVEAGIAYGTPAMAQAVGALVESHPGQGVIVMLGHRDGLLTYGQTPEQACWLMTRWLAKALSLADSFESKGEVGNDSAHSG